jgi:dolichyl-phosphate-mannose--protein O-mannosyl transferase
MGKPNKKNDNQKQMEEKEKSKETDTKIKDFHPNFDRKDLAILLLIVAITIFIRIYDLSLPDKVYFDETHYVPAARAYLEGKEDPNYIHPPLAKEIMAGFMKLYGDDPIGWRAGSVAFGTLMVILMYLMGIMMFQSRFIAIFSASLLSVDFLHIVQSRIATLDIYIAFFIFAGYYCTWLIYKSYTNAENDTGKKYKNPILYISLSAFFFACAISVKLSGIAGPIGAYLFLAIALTLEKKKIPFKQLAIIALVFAIIIPIVYLSTHIPLYLERHANNGKIQAQDLTYSRTFKFHYTDKFTHPYLSQMWQWPTVHRPIWYHWVKDENAKLVTGIFAVGSLLFWWSFLAIFIDMVYRAIVEKDRKIIFIVCGYLTLYLFWLSSASKFGGYWHLKGGFFYYMLPCVPFMALGVAETLADLRDTRLGMVSIVIFCIGLIGFLIAFYPILAGLTVPSSYYDQIMKIGIFKSWI